MDLRDQLQTNLGNAYTIERELGGGGMSRVFLAEERELGRQVVIKVLSTDMAASLSLDRFKREVALAARLQHPHIVPLLTAGDAGGIPYFTMPYQRGDSLRAALIARGESPIPIPDAVRMLREVASALVCAHDAGIVHRDIKPDNILVSGGAAMVTDFGVAKAVHAASDVAHAITASGVSVGTPGYMAPEQVAGDPEIDQRADIYAWGIVAYEVLTGASPFHGRSPHEAMAAHVTEAPDPVENRRPSVPRPLAQLVMRCLEKRPADRPQTAQEVVQALDAVSSGDRVAGTGRLRAMYWRRRRLSRAGMVIGGVGILAAAVAFVALRRPGIHSIAVLPFRVTPASDTAALDHVASGLTDGMRRDLMRIPGLAVAASASSEVMKDSTNLRRVADALHVASVLTAKVQQRDKRLLVTAEIDTGGFAMWEATIDGDTDNPLAALDELRRRVVEAMQPRFSSGRLTVSAQTHTPDTRTWELYSRGLVLESSGDKQGLLESQRYFREAAARDSAFAPAFVGIAWVSTELADAFFAPSEVIPDGLRAAQHAIALDERASAAHSILGLILFGYYHDWAGARRELDRAIALDPNNPEPHIWRGWQSMLFADTAAAVADVRAAVARDPLNAYINFYAAGIMAAVGDPDSAIALRTRFKRLFPTFASQEDWSGEAYRRKGQPQLAFEAALAAEQLPGENNPSIGRVVTLADMGRQSEARQVMDSIAAKLAKGAWYMPEFVARGWLVLGERDRALAQIERGATLLSGGESYLFGMFPEYRQLLGDPRFERLLERTKMTDAMRRR
jgi:serine/threonine-protein kinase